jgi:WXXGXW repeat (2 copies)
MKKVFTGLMFAGVLAMAACSAGVVATRPDEVVYARPAAPGPDYIWIGGDWVWSGGAYHWHEGRWDKGREGHAWHEGHWESHGSGWRWNKGHW